MDNLDSCIGLIILGSFVAALVLGIIQALIMYGRMKITKSGASYLSAVVGLLTGIVVIINKEGFADIPNLLVLALSTTGGYIASTVCMDKKYTEDD